MAHVGQSRGFRVGRPVAVAVAVAVAAVGLSAALVAPAAGASSARHEVRVVAPPTTVPPPCSGVRITQFDFSPSTVPEGAQTHLEVAIENCTDHAFSGSLETFGVLVCEVLDPVSQSVSLPAHVAEATLMSYTAPDCAGRGHITGRLMKGSKLLQTRTAALRVVPPPSA